MPAPASTTPATDLKHSIIYSYETSDRCWCMLMRGAVKIELELHLSQLQTTAFGQDLQTRTEEYLQAQEEASKRRDSVALSRPNLNRPFDLVCEKFGAQIWELAPAGSLEGLTLQDLAGASCYYLKLEEADGEVVLMGLDRVTVGPTCDIAPFNHVKWSADEVLSVSTKIPADSLSIAAEGRDGRSVTAQGVVRDSGGQSFFFKTREDGREYEFTREVGVLSEIKRLDLAAAHGLRISTLEGLVISDDQAVIGFVLACVPLAAEGGPFMSTKLVLQEQHWDRWREQVERTVEVLHDSGLCWGDVNAGNIVIDLDMNAWVIDFGGKNNAEFVDDELAETFEGDLQGVRRLFDDWLPKRRDELLSSR